MSTVDACTYATIGRRAKKSVPLQVLPGFVPPYPVIEWRLLGRTPFAAIHRYAIDGRTRERQVLTVHKLNPDRTFCLAAIMPVQKRRDANVEARRVADQLLPTFRWVWTR